MSLRSEVKEAMRNCAVAFCQRFPHARSSEFLYSVQMIEHGTRNDNDTSGLVGEMLDAADAVIDRWEERTYYTNSTMPKEIAGLYPNRASTPRPNIPVTVLMRKQEPAPDVTKLARRAVKEWRRRFGDAEPLSDAMDALADALDK